VSSADKKNYKQYPKEFKEEAVALVREQGSSVSEAQITSMDRSKQ
jgi:transposase